MCGKRYVILSAELCAYVIENCRATITVGQTALSSLPLDRDEARLISEHVRQSQELMKATEEATHAQ